MKPQRVAGTRAALLERPLGAAIETEGAQLVEFALVLPLLLVFLLGIMQFGGAFSLKQKMANAARAGARIAISNGVSDSSCGSIPCSIQAAAQAVANYMTNAGVDSSCVNPGALSSTGTFTWTYSCASGISMTIDRSYSYVTADGQPMTGTQVTLTYPYNWFFNSVFRLLVPGSNIGLPTRLTETAVMQNLVPNN